MCWNLELNFVIFWQNLQNARSNWSLVGNGLLSSLGPLASPLVSALAVYFWWKVVRRLAWWLQHLAVTRPPRPRSPESRQKQMKTSSCFGTRPLGSFRTTRKSNIISLPPQRCKRLSEWIRPPRRFRSQNIFVQFFFPSKIIVAAGGRGLGSSASGTKTCDGCNDLNFGNQFFFLTLSSCWISCLDYSICRQEINSSRLQSAPLDGSPPLISSWLFRPIFRFFPQFSTICAPSLKSNSKIGIFTALISSL